ncbi:VHS1030 protein [Vibrio phage 1]|nr:VHS1030 protein [Vibrio phage 1]
MNALQIAANPTFQAIAIQEALETLSRDTGITVAALIEQFPRNLKLQTRVAEMVAKAAEVMAETLNK